MLRCSLQQAHGATRSRIGLLLAAYAVHAIIGCAAPSRAVPVEAAPRHAEAADASTSLGLSPHVRFGVPIDGDASDDYLMDKDAYVVSYHRARGVPNWVAWRLSASDLGAADRSDSFEADERVPPEFRRIMPNDYARSGYDRGHLCPSAHRTSNGTTNSATFLMSNMLPQRHALNAGPWKGVETYERELVAKNGNEVYVVAGGVFSRTPKTFGPGVAVPVAFFRVTIVVAAGSGPTDISERTPVLAVEMPNDDSAKGRKWHEFRVTVDRVEADTGYDFLSRIPDDVENAIEAKAP